MSRTSTSGYADAQHTPVGATVTRVYFCEPGGYTSAADNTEYDTYTDALEAAIARHEEAERHHREHYASTPEDRYLPLPERFSLDCRWTMAWAADHTNGLNTTGSDTVMSRTTYETLAEGREHLDRIRRFTYTPTLRDGSPYRAGGAGMTEPTAPAQGGWRHQDDGSTCTSYPDSLNFTYTDDTWVCGHGRTMICQRREHDE